MQIFPTVSVNDIKTFKLQRQHTNEQRIRMLCYRHKIRIESKLKHHFSIRLFS